MKYHYTRYYDSPISCISCYLVNSYDRILSSSLILSTHNGSTEWYDDNELSHALRKDLETNRVTEFCKIKEWEF